MVTRTKIYFPKFDGAIESYVKNFLKKNLWRVASTLDYEDAMQEAYLVFMILKTRYGTTDTPQHFMGLFKTSWTRRFHDLSTVDSKYRGRIYFLTEEEEEIRKDEVAGDSDTDGLLSILLSEAPEEIRKLMTVMLSIPQTLLMQAIKSWESVSGSDDYINMLSKLAGLPAGFNVEREFVDFILH